MTMTTDQYNNIVEGVKDKYEPRVMDLLRKVRDVVRAAGMATDDEPFDLSADDYRWAIRAWRTPKPGENNQCIDISLEIAEAREYGDDDETYGINFGLDIVEWGGLILGGIAPYNFTDQCWVDARNAEAVETRFKLIEDANLAEIPALLRKA